MKIDIYAMLKTLLFTLENGKNLSSGMELLVKTAKTKKDKKVYTAIYNDLKEGSAFSYSLKKNKLGSLDITQFLTMAESGANFKVALERILHYLEVKEEFERESNEKTTLPFIYFFIVSIVVLGVKFIAVPYQQSQATGYSQEIIELITNHLYIAQVMADILFVFLLLTGSYFIILMIALFSTSYGTQAIAKELALRLPIISNIVKKFEKFILFSMIGEMLQSGVSFKNSISAAVQTTSISTYKKALQYSLDSVKYEGKLVFHDAMYDDMEQALMLGVGSSQQVGKVMVEISNRAKSDALKLSTKFFRMITIISIFLMAFAVFIEFYTVVLTQILIQKGLIDLSRGTGTY